MKILSLSLLSVFLFTACGNQEHLPSFALQGDQVVTLSSSNAEVPAPNTVKSIEETRTRVKAPNDTTSIRGSICSWDYGIGIGGIYSTLEEFQARVQSRVDSGQITHCVSVSGTILPLRSPKGFFGPCLGAVAQGNSSMELWSSCASTVQ